MTAIRTDRHFQPQRSSPAAYAVVGAHVDVHGMSDRGKVRERNEDQFLIADLDRTMRVRDTTLHLAPARRALAGGQAKLLVVADGLGGHRGGDVASALAVDAMVECVLDDIPWVAATPSPDVPPDEALAPFRRAVACCEARVRAAENGGPGRRMATTLTVGLLTGHVLEVAHAGDSRCYVLRRGTLTRITHDHTLFEMLRAQGVQAIGHRHVLYNAIGADDRNVTAELHRVPLERGDTVLLCSDGLTRHLDDDEIKSRLRTGSARACCQALVAAANEAGGEDNITVIVARL
jgi:protein phosphatase